MSLKIFFFMLAREKMATLQAGDRDCRKDGRARAVHSCSVNLLADVLIAGNLPQCANRCRFRTAVVVGNWEPAGVMYEYTRLQGAREFLNTRAIDHET